MTVLGAVAGLVILVLVRVAFRAFRRGLELELQAAEARGRLAAARLEPVPLPVETDPREPPPPRARGLELEADQALRRAAERAEPLPEPTAGDPMTPPPDWTTDTVYQHTAIRPSFLDRVRILLGSPILLTVQTYVETRPGRTEAWSVVQVPTLWARLRDLFARALPLTDRSED